MTLLESDGSGRWQKQIWRCRKLLHLAEKIAPRRKTAGDARSRLLIALSWGAKVSSITLLRVSGLLKPDGIVVDARTVNVWACWSTPDLTALDGLKQALESGAVTAAQFESWLSTQSKTPQRSTGRSR